MPDQRQFLDKWFDWHQGYRIIKHEDGSEEHELLLGERLADVAPGFLPRTIDELRSGSTRESLVNESLQSGRLNPPAQRTTTEQLVIDPEDRIFDSPSTSNNTDHLIASSTLLSPSVSSAIYLQLPTLSSTSSNEPPERQTQFTNNHDSNPVPLRDQFRRIAALRREVQELRAGIERVMSGLQDLGENIPDSQDALQHTTNLTARLGNIEAILSNPQNRISGSTALQHAMDHTLIDVSTETRVNATLASMETLIQQNEAILAGGGIQPGRAVRQAVPPPDSSTVSRRTSRVPSWASSRESSSRLPVAEQQLYQARNRLDTARAAEQVSRRHLTSATSNQEQAQASLRHAINHRELCERDLSNTERSQRRAALVYGSREEIESQGHNYESPISGMFNTWHRRYNAAEEQRRQDRILPEILAAEDRFIESTTAEPSPVSHERVRTVEEGRPEVPRDNIRHLIESASHTSQPSELPPLSSQGTGGGIVQSDAYMHSLNPHLWAHEVTPSIRERLHTPASTVNPVPELGSPSDFSFRRPPLRTQSRSAAHVDALNRITEMRRDLTRAQRDRHVRNHTNVEAELMEIRNATTQSTIGSGARTMFGMIGDFDEYSESDIERIMATGGITLGRPKTPEPPKSLDKDDGRPEPVDEENMMVKMECKICFAQVATVALLPCGKCLPLLFLSSILNGDSEIWMEDADSSFRSLRHVQVVR